MASPSPVDKWSWTSISTFQTCPKLFEHIYIKGYKTIERPRPYLIGSSVHRFLEIWYATWDQNQALHSALQIFEEEKEKNQANWGDKEMAMHLDDLAMVSGMCLAYVDYYKETDKKEFQSILTEQRFSVSIGKDTFHGFIDLLVKTKDGWFIMETKTRSMSSNLSNEFRSSPLNGQILSQVYGARRGLGIPVKGVVFNMIKKPGIRLRKGETREAFRARLIKEYTTHAEAKGYFQRHPIFLDKNKVEECIKDLAQWMRIARNIKRFPMATTSCDGKYGQCPFIHACLTGTYPITLYKKESK